MLGQSLLVLASAALALGSPTTKSDISCRAPMADPPLPLTGGATELPPVPEGLELKVIALGLGIQNYTCASVGATAVSTGALAMFYDISLLYPESGPNALTLEKFNQLPAFALNHHAVPLHFNDSTVGRVEVASPGASLTRPFTRAAPLDLGEFGSVPFVGHHFFNTEGAPTFILQRGRVNVVAAKKGSVPAPGSADPGPMGTGAVAWLALDANSNSRGASLVYRVETAGGNSHGCAKGAGQDSTSYSAQYWFYGPK